MSASDYQVGGDHYRKPIQPWDAMDAWMSPEEFRGFLRGNVIKYVARCNDKGGVEDLKKAKHYLEKLIEKEELRHKLLSMISRGQKKQIADAIIEHYDKTPQEIFAVLRERGLYNGTRWRDVKALKWLADQRTMVTNDLLLGGEE